MVRVLCTQFFHKGLVCVGLGFDARFAALTMKSVGKAAGEMVEEVKRQFSLTDSKGKTILTGSTELKPDYDRCISISTKSSLKDTLPHTWFQHRSTGEIHGSNSRLGPCFQGTLWVALASGALISGVPSVSDVSPPLRS